MYSPDATPPQVGRVKTLE
ncbi:MAG TPA: hypothetical protein VLA84_03495 [Microcoleus sp.]|nr:hypothetical protein [Microcoleus sp.]